DVQRRPAMSSLEECSDSANGPRHMQPIEQRHKDWPDSQFNTMSPARCRRRGLPSICDDRAVRGPGRLLSCQSNATAMAAIFRMNTICDHRCILDLYSDTWQCGRSSSRLTGSAVDRRGLPLSVGNDGEERRLCPEAKRKLLMSSPSYCQRFVALSADD